MERYYDRLNSDIKYVYTFGLDKCIEACEQTEACVDVSYVPRSAYDNGICYLKSAAQWGLLKMDVWGARKLPSPSCPDSNGTMYTSACGAEYALNAALIERAGTSRRVLRLRMWLFWRLVSRRVIGRAGAKTCHGCQATQARRKWWRALFPTSMYGPQLSVRNARRRR